MESLPYMDEKTADELIKELYFDIYYLVHFLIYISITNKIISFKFSLIVKKFKFKIIYIIKYIYIYYILTI